MNDAARHTDRSYFRADYILVATTVLVCLLVAFLLLALARENALHRQTLASVFDARAARDATLSLSQALADADAARRAVLIAGDRDAQLIYGAAQIDARTHIHTLHRLGEQTTPEVAAAALTLRTLGERYLTELDTVTAGQLRSARTDPTAATRDAINHAANGMREQVNLRNDTARGREDAVRRRIDIIAAILAVVAFLAPVLAILAVRRERRLWQTSNALAESAREQAIEADLAKSRFLAVASHDMRQPLHALSLYISALERRIENPEARDILTKMDRATQSLVGMFSKLLDLARVQAGAVKLEIVAAPLQEIIDRVAAEHPESAVSFAHSDAIVLTDPVLLERLLGNLVVNALKHGGGKARIELKPQRGGVAISVVDDGPGIAREDQDRVFGEFVRLGKRTDGLGLGLTIVRRIAALLNVPLTLESAPGHGARFTVIVPRAETQRQPTLVAAQPNAIAGQPILVVDDDELALEAMASTLADLGASVRSAANEADARQIVASGFAPRLIIMDLRIDGEMAGIEIARRLRQQLAPATPPVIVVTGDTAPETLAILKLSGFAWLIKPVKPADIEQAARVLLSST